MKQMIIATKNRGKAVEFKEFFGTYGVEARALTDLAEELPDIEETGATFEENAALKAEKIAAILQLPVLADDSGLIIDKLHGEPGVFSARYAGEPTNDQANIDKVLHKMRNVPQEKRTGRFICVLAISVPGEKTTFSTGYCEGEIASTQAGLNGFGYDPIFVPEGYNMTMAQLSATEKNLISHRKNAIAQLDNWMQKW